MRFVPRRKIFLGVIPFPETKDAGKATIRGEEIKAFEDNPGALRVQLIAADSSKITDDLTIKANVSYDEGKTWTEVASFDDLKNGAGKVSVMKDATLPDFAPRVRLDAVFGNNGALAKGHGCKVYAELAQGEVEDAFNKHAYFENVVSIPNDIVTGRTEIAYASSTQWISGNIMFFINLYSSLLTITDQEVEEKYHLVMPQDDGQGNITYPDPVQEGYTRIEMPSGEAPFTTVSNFLETNSDLVEATPVLSEPEGWEGDFQPHIIFKAKEAGSAGNSISFSFVVTATEGDIPEPLEFSLEGGTDAKTGIDAIKATGIGDSSFYAYASYGVITITNQTTGISEEYQVIAEGEEPAEGRIAIGPLGGQYPFEGIAAGINSGSNLVTAFGVDDPTRSFGYTPPDYEGPYIEFTAKEGGTIGNSIKLDFVIEYGGEQMNPNQIALTGGIDEIAGSSEASSEVIYINASNLKKVVLISNSDKQGEEGETFGYTLMTSHDGKTWWAVDEAEAITTGNTEKEYTSKLGNYLRVDFKAEDIEISEHNAKIHMLAYYA